MSDAPMTLTRTELDHLLTVLADAAERGDYYGNRMQYWARHERIMQKVRRAMTPRGGEER